MSAIPPTQEEIDTALVLCGVNRTGAGTESAVSAMRLQARVKTITQSEPAIAPDRVGLLRKIGNAQSELGRLNKLLDEIRVEVLRLTVK